jgi:D-aminopeptidase
MTKTFVIVLLITLQCLSLHSQERGRIRSFGIEPGVLTPGSWNAITDVEGVKVGHSTLIRGDSVRTGVTVIMPHEGNLFQQKVPAAVSVGNGFGKAIGFTQVEELGNLETPIGLTNTLSVFTVANSMVKHSLSLPGNESVRSVNPVVGETNDGYLNDIRGQHIKEEHFLEALRSASFGKVMEGNIGAGTGTLCLGFKGGIGTSSRLLPEAQGGYTVGVLVQTNFGGILRIDGAPVGETLSDRNLNSQHKQSGDGSCMIIIATDAPLSARNLERLAKRSFLALGRVGSYMSNGSGDYAIAFSTHPECRIPNRVTDAVRNAPVLENDRLSPLFLAVVESTEEAIYNSLFMAEDMKGFNGRQMRALPIPEVIEILKDRTSSDKHGRK